MRFRDYVLLMILVAGFFARSNAQGVLQGKVLDARTSEELVGATVLLQGTKLGASTDIEGTFVVRNIPEGTYNVRFAYIGYTPKIVTGVAFKAGQTISVTVTLDNAAVDVDEVVVTAERVSGTEATLLAERRRSAVIGDGISSEQVKRTPDATTADALKRVTGLSVVDNKFVFIRGVTDRYNAATLDGATLASTDPGKKSFSFDILPANLIDQATVVKSATPDLPGDFTGGLVQLRTLAFPDRFFARLILGSSYNAMTTGQDMLASSAGRLDWLGMDDGARAYPGGNLDPTAAARMLRNDWAPRSISGPPGYTGALSLGGRLMLSRDEEEDDQFGYIAALSYRNGAQREQKDMPDWEVGRMAEGYRYNYNVLWSGLANVSVKFGRAHKISFKNTFSQAGENVLAQFAIDDASLQAVQQTMFNRWTERRIYTGQLAGEHALNTLGATFEWRASASSSRREDPDEKRAVYQRSWEFPELPFEATINQRSWAHLNDRTLAWSSALSVPLGAVQVKAGFAIEGRNTGYEISYFNIVPDYGAGALVSLPLDRIYSQQNYGRGKFVVMAASKASDNYYGDQLTTAAYVMGDVSFTLSGQEFRLTGGARMEDFTQNVNVPLTLTPDGPFTRSHLYKKDILPSVNFTYPIAPDVNIRLAYSHTVNRPEFRERANSTTFDFLRYEIVGGNPDLRRALIRNYDARVEWFPAPGELVAVSYFTKNISDAIEEQLLFSATRTRVWFNSPQALNYGAELEFRTSLGFLGNSLANFTVGGNYTRIFSRVHFMHVSGNSSITETLEGTRPMQGQSPYLINLVLQYTQPDWGTTITGSYNTFGRRLDAVGFMASDVYEEPRDLIDLSLGQVLLEDYELRLAARNVTGADRVLTRGGLLYDRTVTGTTYSLSLSAKF